MSPQLKERIAAWFPYVLSAALPLAGLFLAGAWALERRREEALGMAAAALLGAIVWIAVLTA